MSKPIHMQHTIAADPSLVYDALTRADALTEWFAERADVSIDQGRYDFWGRFTPGTPDREGGRHEIQIAERNRRLCYKWQLRGSETIVDIRLRSNGDGHTTLGLWHSNVRSLPQGVVDSYSMGDIWWLWLENLRRYAEGRQVVRCDFSADRQGDVVQSIEIDGSPDQVWMALTDPDYRKQWIATGRVAELEVGENWINWGSEGALKVLDIDPGKSFTMEWIIDDDPTVVTWTVEQAGSRTRLTLAHSGFAPDRRSDGEWGGWINYLSLVKSVVEYSGNWLPPIQEIVSGAAMYYAVSVWARQEELLEDSDAAWTG